MARSRIVAVTLCAMACSLGTTGSVSAEPPLQIADFATAEELEAEAQARLAELEPLLEEETAFADRRKRIQQVASMLAVAAQALVDHEQDSPLKPYAPDLREAALGIATADTVSKATEEWKAAQAALAKTSAKAAAPEADWAKLVKQRPIMEEMEVRMQQLQRALRRPKDPAVESRHAIAVAVANLTTLADTHEVKDRDKLPEWDRLSRQMLDQMKDLSTAIKQKQTKEAQAVFKAARATCIECHREFKKEN